MKKILVIADPCDSKQIAYEKALKLAKLSSATLHVAILCYESISIDPASTDDADLPARLKEAVLQQTHDWWQQFLLNNQPPLTVSYEICWEKSLHRWVLEHCQQHHYDLIVKTGHRSETAFYTPSDWQLFRDAPVPVYSVNSSAFKSKKVVLAALDLTTSNEEKQQLNRTLLEQAFRLSVQTDAALHCCYAIKIPTLVKDLDLIDISAHIHKLQDKTWLAHQSWLDQYAIDQSLLHAKEGKPWQVINHFSNKLHAQCIVIGSRGKSGLAAKLIGNTAEKVIHHARCDLLVIGNPS